MKAISRVGRFIAPATTGYLPSCLTNSMTSKRNENATNSVMERRRKPRTAPAKDINPIAFPTLSRIIC